MNANQRQQLVQAARAATTRAFLTAPGGTSYGAAVLTAGGAHYQAGQYSSFNHVTNTHAEHAALILATMADDPDVVALAVASTAPDPVTRPCGVCRQIFAEHAARTGRDFEVLMAHRHGPGYEVALVSELLPFAWKPKQEAAGAAQSPDLFRTTPLRESIPYGGVPLRVGDHVLLRDGSVALVWDAHFQPGKSLTKVKYAPPANGARRKVAHSFTAPLQYMKELHDLGWDRPTRAGGRAALVERADVAGVLPSLPLEQIGERVPGPLLDLLIDAGLSLASIRVTGSRALGLQRPSSDWDLVIAVDPQRLSAVRGALFAAVDRRDLTIPPSSGTWKLLDRIFPGGREAILCGRRFVDTVQSGSAAVALIFVPDEKSSPCLDDAWQLAGRGLLHGVVRTADRVAFKRAEYWLVTEENGLVPVTCFHKTANLLSRGDVISVRGWCVQQGEVLRLIQVLPEPDGIVWISTQESR